MRQYDLFSMLAMFLVFWLPSNVGAQDNGIFSGQGVRFPEFEKSSPPKSKWPKLLDFSKDESSALPVNPLSGLFSRQAKPEKPAPGTTGVAKSKFDWFKKKPDETDDDKQPKPFSGLTELFPKRDPNSPGLLEQMNSKSKSWIDRTTGWTQRKNQKKRDKSFSTWDAISKDWRAFQLDAERSSIPAQPPVRSAEALGKPRVRF